MLRQRLIGLVLGLIACSDQNRNQDPITEPAAITLVVVSGTVFSVTGQTVGNVTVFVSCGVTGPGDIAIGSTANSSGQFRVNVAEVPWSRMPQQFRCRITTPGNSPPLGITYFEAPVNTTSPAQINVELREGLKQPLPDGWTS